MRSSESSAGREDLRLPELAATLELNVTARPVARRPGSGLPRRSRTTMRYDRARVSLDRHATYIVAAYIAGAAR
jgi:integrase/recombinase XerD